MFTDLNVGTAVPDYPTGYAMLPFYLTGLDNSILRYFTFCQMGSRRVHRRQLHRARQLAGRPYLGMPILLRRFMIEFDLILTGHHRAAVIAISATRILPLNARTAAATAASSVTRTPARYVSPPRAHHTPEPDYRRIFRVCRLLLSRSLRCREPATKTTTMVRFSLS